MRSSSVHRLLGLGAVLLAGAPAWADEYVHFGPHDVQTVFAIGKSDDGNQVQYGLRLDEQCKPVGKEPVVGYWRTYDLGPTSPLLPFSWMDKLAYAIDRQAVFPRGPEGPAAEMTIRTASKRLIELFVTPGPDGTCRGEARTPLRGRPAVLKLIYVKLTGIFIDWVELRGVALDDGQEVKERVRP
jgi:hypothetical protein